MIISVYSQLWQDIFYQIKDHIVEVEGNGPGNGKRLEACLADMGLRPFNDGSVGGRWLTWTHVEIADDIDITELWLRWA